MKLGALLLAAGASRRMGQHKLLLPWGTRTVVGQALAALKEANVADPIIVVTGFDAPNVEATCAPHKTFVHNPRWADGMFTSVLAGLPALPQDLAGCFIALGDMPLVPPALYQRLAIPGRIVIPTYEGRRGHPVLFPMDVLRTPGCDSLRCLIQRHVDRVCLVEVDEPGVRIDLDTPEEYARYRPISSI